MGRDRGGRGGTVVITGSTLGLRPCACVPIYTATKHAIIGFTRSFGVRKSHIIKFYQIIVEKFELHFLTPLTPHFLIQEIVLALRESDCVRMTK